MGYQATNGGDGGGGISKGVSGLGKALGVMASVLGTPALYSATKTALFKYLYNAWGEGIAGLLMWVMAAAEAYAIYAAVSLGFTILAIWAMTSYAARRFGGQ
jgi:cobalamin synthase